FYSDFMNQCRGSNLSFCFWQACLQHLVNSGLRLPISLHQLETFRFFSIRQYFIPSLSASFCSKRCRISIASLAISFFYVACFICFFEEEGKAIPLQS